MPPLASVIRSAIYPKVNDDKPLALFHKKFLGKSMEDEATEWQKAQAQIGGQPEDEDQDKYEAMEENQDQDQGKGKPDEDEDDILPGCYILDISINGMVPKSLWIRADYIRVFNFCQAYYDEHAKPMNQAPSAVLTGQPGIGKSFWIYYAACRLLAERKAFIWFYEESYYLFVDDGVYELPPSWRHYHFSHIIWTLVDSDQDSVSVPEILIPHGTQLFVMYVTSPTAKRWSRMDKTTRNLVVVMNPWNRGEIQQVAHLSSLEGITKTHVNKIFNELGPVPRLCIDQASDQLTWYRKQLHQAISNITTEDIWKLACEASGLTMDTVSHKIFLLSRQDRDVVHSQVVVTPITDSIKSRLSNQFRNLQQAEQVYLYQFYEKIPGLRAIAGIFGGVEDVEG